MAYVFGFLPQIYNCILKLKVMKVWIRLINFGIPKEQYGFSNDASALLGPPSFQNASFDLVDNKTVNIKMK